MSDIGFIIKNQNYYPPYWVDLESAQMVECAVIFNGDFYIIDGAEGFGRIRKSIDRGYNFTTVWGNDVWGRSFCLNTDTNILYLYIKDGYPWGDSVANNGVWSSTDGSSWTQVTSNTDIRGAFHYSPLDGYFYTLRYGAPTWEGIPLRSLDAINWVEMTTDTPIYVKDYAEFNGELYACGYSGGNGLVHKLTGTTWNLVYTIDYPTSVECYCLKVFDGYLYVGIGVFIDYNPYYHSRGEIHRTANGIDWDLVGSFDVGVGLSDIRVLEVFENKLHAVNFTVYITENGTDWISTYQNTGFLTGSAVDDSFVYFVSSAYSYS